MTFTPSFSRRGFRLAPFPTLLLLAVCLGCGANLSKPSLRVYCAAVMRQSMEQLARDYQESTGVDVQLQFGGSNTLLAQIEISRVGDMYLAADSSYIDQAQEKGLVRRAAEVALITPVLIVQQGNPLEIHELADVFRLGARVALADPGAAAIGRTTRIALQSAGCWREFEQAVRNRGVFTPTVNGAASTVTLGSVDAAVVWDTVAISYDVDALRVDELEAADAAIKVAVLESSKHAELAGDFVQYITQSDEGRRVLTGCGFRFAQTGHQQTLLDSSTAALVGAKSSQGVSGHDPR